MTIICIQLLIVTFLSSLTTQMNANKNYENGTQKKMFDNIRRQYKLDNVAIYIPMKDIKCKKLEVRSKLDESETNKKINKKLKYISKENPKANLSLLYPDINGVNVDIKEIIRSKSKSKLNRILNFKLGGVLNYGDYGVSLETIESYQSEKKLKQKTQSQGQLLRPLRPVKMKLRPKDKLKDEIPQTTKKSEELEVPKGKPQKHKRRKHRKGKSRPKTKPKRPKTKEPHDSRMVDFDINIEHTENVNVYEDPINSVIVIDAGE